MPRFNGTNLPVGEKMWAPKQTYVPTLHGGRNIKIKVDDQIIEIGEDALNFIIHYVSNITIYAYTVSTKFATFKYISNLIITFKYNSSHFYRQQCNT